MKCDICGLRESVMFVQEISGTNTRELHLCAQCAAERNINVNGGKLEIPFGKLFQQRAAARLCPVCGLSLADIRTFRKTGCAGCYKEFGKEITALLSQSGENAVYRGSLPKRLSGFRSILEDRALLENSLSESLAREDYEKAAVYRDRIRDLDRHND